MPKRDPNLPPPINFATREWDDFIDEVRRAGGRSGLAVNGKVRVAKFDRAKVPHALIVVRPYNTKGDLEAAIDLVLKELPR